MYNWKLWLGLFHKYVGTDEFGNKYYQKSSGKRVVVYANSKLKEASSVPAAWHLWLHGSSDLIPEEIKRVHIPNQSGTKNAYIPESLKNFGSSRVFYKAWNPSNAEKRK